MNNTSLGLLEFTSIARGMEATDAMTKAADVRLEEAKTICPGKYLAVVTGQVSAVSSAIMAGREVARQDLLDELVIPNIHDDVADSLHGMSNITKKGAVGVLEFFNVASAVLSADAAVKAADIRLIEIRLAMGIGGKSFVVMTGELASVTAAVDAGAKAAGDNGMLINKTVIASPTQEFFNKIL